MSELATLVLKSPEGFDLVSVVLIPPFYFMFLYKDEFPPTGEHLGKKEGYREDFLC